MLITKGEFLELSLKFILIFAMFYENLFKIFLADKF